jgi:hypothetical protein
MTLKPGEPSPYELHGDTLVLHNGPYADLGHSEIAWTSHRIGSSRKQGNGIVGSWAGLLMSSEFAFQTVIEFNPDGSCQFSGVLPPPIHFKYESANDDLIRWATEDSKCEATYLQSDDKISVKGFAGAKAGDKPAFFHRMAAPPPLPATQPSGAAPDDDISSLTSSASSWQGAPHVQ